MAHEIPETDDERIDHDDVRAFLARLQERGWYVRKVSTGAAILIDRYKIDFGTRARAIVDHRRSNDDHVTTDWVSVVDAEDEEDGPVEFAEDPRHLEMLVGKIAHRHGVEIDAAPEAVRLVKTEPASNVVRLVRLATSGSIAAVFDPYLDDRGLEVLLAMRSLGARFDPAVRLLTSLPFGPKLHEPFLGSALVELGATGGVTKRLSSKQHRRFMLLGGDQVLIFGNSLNQMAHNETASVVVEPNDVAFFDGEWGTATAP